MTGFESHEHFFLLYVKSYFDFSNIVYEFKYINIIETRNYFHKHDHTYYQILKISSMNYKHQ